MSKTEELLKTLKDGQWDEGEAIWLEILEGNIESITPFQEAVNELWRRGQRERARELMDLTATACREAGKPALWMGVLRLITEYIPPNRPILDNFTEAFKQNICTPPLYIQMGR